LKNKLVLYYNFNLILLKVNFENNEKN
jgi:hypothetical protein